VDPTGRIAANGKPTSAPQLHLQQPLGWGASKERHIQPIPITHGFAYLLTVANTYFLSKINTHNALIAIAKQPVMNSLNHPRTCSQLRWSKVTPAFLSQLTLEASVLVPVYLVLPFQLVVLLLVILLCGPEGLLSVSKGKSCDVPYRENTCAR
jgi:hypothetical protein